MEPRIRFERIAYALQVRCATIAPARHMAGVEGFEPSPTTVLETGMLPLHQTPITSRFNRITFVRRLPYPFG